MHSKIKNTFLYLVIILKITNRFENKEYFPKISGYVNMTTELWKSLRFWAEFSTANEINISKNMYVYVYVPTRNWSFFGMDCDGECKLWPGMGDISESWLHPAGATYLPRGLSLRPISTEEFCTLAGATCFILGNEWKWPENGCYLNVDHIYPIMTIQCKRYHQLELDFYNIGSFCQLLTASIALISCVFSI